MSRAPATATPSAPTAQFSPHLPTSVARRGGEEIQTTAPPEYSAQRRQYNESTWQVETRRFHGWLSQQFNAHNGVESLRVVRGLRRDGKALQGVLEAGDIYNFGGLAKAGQNTLVRGRGGDRRWRWYMARWCVGPVFLRRLARQTQLFCWLTRNYRIQPPSLLQYLVTGDHATYVASSNPPALPRE